MHAALLTAFADGTWKPVTTGESGALVLLAEDGSRYAKLVAVERITELEQERDRLAWVGAHGIAVPQVLDWSVNDAGARLITSAVSGVPADTVPADVLERAWPAVADALRRVHDLPADTCPFTRHLTGMIALARDVVARGAVNPDFLPDEYRNTPPDTLLARLLPQLPARLAQEATETVVCHGDPCLPNIILDPDTATVAGFIDLGRLGTADPYADIALLLANARETWSDDERARAADDLFARIYGIDLDDERRRFYLDLDPLTWG
ncbi:APH(3'') family aminoglycoside O-phosphotransferase [Nocardia transvalensis]|uniref:APH(3'') family aminoglycoside O-phosphotransferase n=1 Tax=Nocardia transvalensis TaxID=37333 RepID=UPI001892DE3A|nr:APH(3'') family aminoglycoside O-phosphotransferase [Nocardia transvalensis]MBF6328062.1 APH(3'') family aminoglycoside O-phosphotransferase [Nocardia transvalensis]